MNSRGLQVEGVRVNNRENLNTYSTDLPVQPSARRNDNHISERSTPFISKTSVVTAVDQAPSPLKKNELDSPTYWPREPRPLKNNTFWTHGSYFWDIIVTLFPVLFLVLGFAALGVNGRARSSFGDSIIEASKYGTTIFPIIFAAVVSRFMRAVALWRCETGSKLGLLEQLIGSQSLAGAVERFFFLRRFNILGILIVLLWLLSPLGSQLSLRLLSIRDDENHSQANIRYLNTTSFLNNSHSIGGSSALASALATLNGLFAASMLASEDVKRSPVDQWNNVKIPRLDELAEQIPWSTPSTESLWVPIDKRANKTWASLSGLILQGLPSDGSSSFIVDSSYLDISCADAVVVTTDDDFSNLKSNDLLKSLQATNLSSPFIYKGKWSSFFIDTTWNNTQPLVLPQPLVYGSVAASISAEKGSSRSIEVYNCSFTYPKVEANISCAGISCAVTHMRRSTRYNNLRTLPPFDESSYWNFFIVVSGALGMPHPGSVSSIEHYMRGSDSPMSIGINEVFAPRYLDIPGNVFAKRLTTVLNTMWQAALCPYGISIGSAVNFSEPVSSGKGCQSATTIADHRKVVKEARYKVNKTRAYCLLAIAFVVEACAVAGVLLWWTAKPPDILGYVSTMTRDNAHINIPQGGNTLTGIERARCLAEMRVGLRDVLPDADVGHIAFCDLDNLDGAGMGQLDRKRSYY